MKKLSYISLPGLMCLSTIAFAHQAAMHDDHHAHHHHHHHHHHMVAKESATAVELSQCWGRFRADGASAAYVEVHNTDKEKSAYLTGVKSTSFAEMMLHESYEENGMKGMRHVDEIEIPAGQTLTLKPGAYHVMLFQPQGVKEGDKVTVTFTLSNGHELSTDCLMKSIAARSFKD